MTLRSRHYETMTAIATALSDSASGIGLTFQVRKKAIHAGTTWLPGAYVAPMQSRPLPFETGLDMVAYRSLVAIIDPSSEGDAVAGLESNLAKIERVEDIFRNKSYGTAPHSLRALQDSFAEPEPFIIERIYYEPTPERFVQKALADGYDLNGVVIVVEAKVRRPDYSTLG